MIGPREAVRLSGPGAIAFVRSPSGTPWCAWTGAANIEHAVPLDTETVMNVGSVAKQITARLTMLAVQEGRLRLDSLVADLLPRLRVSDITILDLIRHGAGIRDAESMLSLAAMRDLDHYTSGDLLTLAYRQQRRASAAGTFLYSNTGYLMLAEILRTTYGQPLQHIAFDKIFVPLGMDSAVFTSDPRTVIPNGASSYRQNADGAWVSEARPVALDGPGSLWCSVRDLDRWLMHVRAVWISGSNSSLPFADYVPYVAADHDPYLYGPGMYADLEPDEPCVFHFGHEHGFSAAVFLARDGHTVISMSNRADLLADRLACQLARRRSEVADLDMQSVVTEVLMSRPTSQQQRTHGSSPGAEGSAEEVSAEYVSEDVPGVLRLVTNERGIHLQRRGACDHLGQPDPDGWYGGPGYRLRPDVSGIALPLTFVLDLDRAPGLRYKRRDGR